MDRTCETCEVKPANNQVDGVWLCVDCIVAKNGVALRDQYQLKRAKIELAGTVEKAPIANARALVRTMAGVMEKLLSGDMDPATARAICGVSGESLKALELIWRMTKDSNG